MSTQTSDSQLLRFQIDPQPGESLRGCSAIAQSAMPRGRTNVIVFGLYAGVALAAYFLTPTTTLTTFAIGLVAVAGTIIALQAEGRSQIRRLQENDPHSRETYFVELSPEGIHTWCLHVDARYPWAEFAKTTENKEFYLFVRASGTGAAIPKRVLNAASEATLRAHIHQWSPDRGAALAREVT